MKLSYLKGFRHSSLATIRNIQNPSADYFTLELDTAPGFTWKPGQHGVVFLPGRDKALKGRKFRGFSFASIMSEGKLLLGTRTGKSISDYKQILLSLKPGDQVQLRGPMGDFVIKDAVSPVVFFASGVGITPFRALLKSLEHDTKRPIEMVYASSQYYLFGDDIQAIVDQNDQMHLYKTAHVEDTNAKLSELAERYQNNAYYYISGAPSVIKSVTKNLKQKGIKGKRIISDEFLGY